MNPRLNWFFWIYALGVVTQHVIALLCGWKITDEPFTAVSAALIAAVFTLILPDRR